MRLDSPMASRAVALAAGAALITACGNSGSHASGSITDGAAGPDDGAASAVGVDAGFADGSPGTSMDAATQTPPPVDAGVCPNMAALLDGGWINVSPPGSNYAST